MNPILNKPTQLLIAFRRHHRWAYNAIREIRHYAHIIQTLMRKSSLVSSQLQLKFTSMVHVEIVMSWIICVQNDLFTSLSASVKQYVQSQGEIVEEKIAPFRLYSTMWTGRMDFHFILTFEKYSIRSSQITNHICENENYCKKWDTLKI